MMTLRRIGLGIDWTNANLLATLSGFSMMWNRVINFRSIQAPTAESSLKSSGL